MAKFITFDTETSGLTRNPNAYMFTFSECDTKGNATVYRVFREDGSLDKKALARLEWIWADENKTRIHKIMHNARFDITMSERLLGRRLEGHKIHDTMALSHLFQNTHPTHKLAALGHELFGYEGVDDPTHKYMSEERGLLDCPDWLLNPYQKDDAIRTMLVFKLFYPKLDEMGFRDEYDMELDLAWTTKEIEKRGMMINVKRCEELRDDCREKEQQALEDFYTVTRDRHKPTDGILRHLLYGKLGLPVIKKTKNSGVPSVDADTLKQLEEKTHHPIFDIIMRRRAYQTGAAHAESYMKFADGDGVIHPSIHPYGTDTGRATCKQPNLLNVSKETTLQARYPIPARRCFRPKPGFVNFHLDYSGIQFRRGVDLSGDEQLIEMMMRGIDPHAVAADIFYADEWRVAQSDALLRKSLRDAAKNGNFSVMFGAGPPKLAATLGLALDIVLPRYQKYKQKFPGLADLAQRIVTEVRQTGYVTTTFGRRLHVPSPHKAMNYLIQGDEACIMKRAQNKVHHYLEEATNGEAGIILPIYDELVIEWPRKRLADAPGCLREIRRIMTDFPQFKVPMDVDCKRSTADWARTAAYKIPA